MFDRLPIEIGYRRPFLLARVYSLAFAFDGSRVEIAVLVDGGGASTMNPPKAPDRAEYKRAYMRKWSAKRRRKRRELAAAATIAA